MTQPTPTEQASLALLPLIRQAAATEDKGYMTADLEMEAHGRARKRDLLAALCLIRGEEAAAAQSWLDSQA